MTQKEKNGNHHLSSRKEDIPHKKSFLDHPHLFSPITRAPSVVQNINLSGCVIKSWRSGPRKCSLDVKSRWPQLVQICSNAGDVYRHNKHFHKNDGNYFIGHSDGQRVTIEAKLSKCCSWEKGRKDMHHLRSSRGKGENATSTAYECMLKDSNGYGQLMQFCHLIEFQGKSYALSLQGSLFVIEDMIDSYVRIRDIGESRAVPSNISRQFREYLIKFKGEILLVFLVSRKSINIVEDVEVFQLDIPKLCWVRVESLGENTLFLEHECHMGVTASEVGCRSNCIYFTHHRVNRWFLYEMETGLIAPVEIEAFY